MHYQVVMSTQEVLEMKLMLRLLEPVIFEKS
jgi:hypothetical protein